MTTKSITLSEDTLRELDRFIDNGMNRSEFIENILREYLTRKISRKQKAARDMEIINQNSEYLNKEAEDVLSYQADEERYTSTFSAENTCPNL